MEIIIELLLQFFGELLLQLIFEALAEVGLQRFCPQRRKPVNFWLAIVGYTVLGIIAGALSLLVFPELFLASRGARLANVILLPILAGGVMALFGVWRRRREQDLIRLDRFAYGYLFALAMALIRFWFGE